MDEANKINSSLMVLGQCMRILRNNQKKLSKTQHGGRPVRTEIPPYRMSKLTELFQEFFEGRGRAVCAITRWNVHLMTLASVSQAMIVNVNPFDTGYHENAAVLEFSALASEISTVTTKLAPALSRKLSVTSNSDRNTTPRASSRASAEAPTSATVRQVRLSLAAPGGSAPVERVIEVVEGNDSDSR
jgi:kinesin family protein 20